MIPMLLDTCVVSRKTPLDGKLEVSAGAAARIAKLGTTFSVTSPSGEGSGTVETFECTCGKRPGGRHIHHFIMSPLLKALTEGSEVRVVLDQGAARIRIIPATTGGET